MKCFSKSHGQTRHFFQSSLLRYWEFNPSEEQDQSSGGRRQNSDVTSEATHVDPQHAQTTHRPRVPWFGRWKGKRRAKDRSMLVEELKPKEKPVKKMPVCSFVFATRPRHLHWLLGHFLR